MENIVANDRFYSDLGDLIEDILDDEYVQEISELPEDYTIEAWQCELEPMFKLSLDWILDRLSENRFPEDNGRIENQLVKALTDNINFDKINKKMPELYYSRTKVILTKQQLIEY